MNADPTGPLVVINVFTPKPGKMDEFLAAQTEGMRDFGGRIPGWKGTRMYRALDERTAAVVSSFASLEEYQAWMASALFDQHRSRVAPLIERAGPQLYRLVHEAGEPV